MTRRTGIKQKVIDALIAGDTTARQIMDRTGLPRQRVKGTLLRLVAAGALDVKGRVVSGRRGRPGHIYGFPERANG